jgi:hypothetical protein
MPEKIRDDQLVLSDPQTYCRVRLTDRFRLPRRQEAEPLPCAGALPPFQLAGPTGPDFRLRFHARVSSIL